MNGINLGVNIRTNKSELERLVIESGLLSKGTTIENLTKEFNLPNQERLVIDEKKRILFPVKYESTTYNGMLKITYKRNQKAKDEYANAYTAYHNLKKTDQIVRLLNRESIHFGGYPSVIMELGRESLSYHVFTRNPPREEVVRLVKEFSKGVANFHEIGWAHREIRPSQVIIVPNRGACISDYGFAKGSTGTQTVKNDKHYTSDEVLRDKARYKEKLIQEIHIGPEEDIYQIGISLYELLAGEESLDILFDDEFDEEDVDDLRSNRARLYRALETDKRFSEDEKYFVRKLTGIEGERYTSLHDFIKDKGKTSKTFGYTHSPKDSLEYINFLQTNKELNEYIATADNYRNTEWKTIKLPMVQKIMDTKEKLEELANNPTVRKVEGVSDEHSKTTGKLSRLVNYELSLIQPHIDNKQRSKEDWLRICEIGFMWGPPMTYANEDDRIRIYNKPEVRKKFTGNGYELAINTTRYSYEDTKNGNTHYHKYKR